MSGIMDQIKQKAKGTMPGPNGALVPGPGGNHSSAQNNQSIDHEAANQGNLGRGFDQGNAAFAQGNLGQGFDTTTGAGYGSGQGQADYRSTGINNTHTGLTDNNTGLGDSGLGHRATGHTHTGHTGSGLGHEHSHTGHTGTGLGAGTGAALGSGTGHHHHTGTGLGSGIGHDHSHTGHGNGLGSGTDHSHNNRPDIGQTNSAYTDPALNHNLPVGHTGSQPYGSTTNPGQQILGGVTGTAGHSGSGIDHHHTTTGVSHSTSHPMDGATGTGIGKGNLGSHTMAQGNKVSSATKGAEYDATGGAIDDRTTMQKVKDTFTPGSSVGKHTKI